MKKISILLLFSLVLVFLSTTDKKVEASTQEYQTFANITLSSGKLLKKYSNEEINEARKKVSKRLFSGWRIHYMNKNVKCSFVSKTAFSIYNGGTTPIEYELNTVTTTVSKTSISCTGTISYSVKGDIKKFKNGLDTSLKIEGSTSESIEVKTTEKFKISVDPKTRVVMYFVGTGYLTNGYAQSYAFWIKGINGGFEYFTVTDIYPKIEKVLVI